MVLVPSGLESIAQSPIDRAPTRQTDRARAKAVAMARVVTGRPRREDPVLRKHQSRTNPPA